MTCSDCSRAAAGPWHGYKNGCRACTARAFARSPVFGIELAKSIRDGAPTDLHMQQLERSGVTHEEAVAASRSDWQVRHSAWGAML